MCLLTFFPAGRIVTDEIETMLTCGCLRNQDGYGWAIALPEEGRILVGKYLNPRQAIETFREARAAAPKSVALFHSRLATAGAEDLRGVHPFPVDGDERTVVAHNGVLPLWAQPSAKDWRSDTRILADEFLVLDALRYGRYRRALGAQIKSDKLVILTVDPQFDRNAFIINADHGEWAEGVWWSNDGYRPSSFRGAWWSAAEDYEPWEGATARRTTGWPSALGSEATARAIGTSLKKSTISETQWYNPFFCSVCKGTKGAGDAIIDPFTEVCQFCKSCALCFEPMNACECWDESRAAARGKYPTPVPAKSPTNPLDLVPGPAILADTDFWDGWTDDEIDEVVGITCGAGGCVDHLSQDQLNTLSDDEWNKLMIDWIRDNPDTMPDWYWTRLTTTGRFRPGFFSQSKAIA